VSAKQHVGNFTAMFFIIAKNSENPKSIKRRIYNCGKA
jgi:hypothetical protein